MFLQAVGAGTLTHQVDDLVFQDTGQPGAQSRAAGKCRLARDDRLKHIVDHVLGQHRVLQPALREPDQILSVSDHLRPADGQICPRGQVGRVLCCGVHADLRCKAVAMAILCAARIAP